MRLPQYSSLQRRGLMLIAASELWERFAFFGVQGLVFLFLRSRIAERGGLEGIWAGPTVERIISGVIRVPQPGQLASVMVGLYTGLIYVAVIIGGLVTDYGIRARRVVAVGGALSAGGYALMAFEPTFLAGMGLVVVGSGGFKGNISNEFALRAPTGPGRDEAFRFFFIAMHFGMLAAPLVCGTLGQLAGWRWGFAAAAAGMLFSLLTYLAVPLRLCRPRGAGRATRIGGAGGAGGRSPDSRCSCLFSRWRSSALSRSTMSMSAGPRRM